MVIEVLNYSWILNIWDVMKQFIQFSHFSTLMSADFLSARLLLYFQSWQYFYSSFRRLRIYGIELQTPFSS